MLFIIEVPFADNAAISKEIPALISGEVILVAFKELSKSIPITVALCGSHKITFAPISINLSTKNNLLSNIFW